MNFTSVGFIFLFLPIVLFFYYFASNRVKNVILLLASIIFYAAGNLKMLSLLILTICINYFFGILLGRTWKYSFEKNISIVCMLIWNIGILFYFKYFSTVINFANDFWGINAAIVEIAFPVGISFFTFRCISYCLDVFWEITPIQYSIVDLALYISFFPQLLSGPITKYRDFESQLKNRKIKIENVCEGVKRIIIGLTKKLFIANRIAIMVNIVFEMNSSERTVALAWIGMIGYLVQLYYDFSGYSDIAIGIGKLFGFNTPENFRYPYASKSIIEFWKRWHITLGEWFNEYMFVPLFRFFQTHKVPFKLCNYFTLFFVWIVIGIWHGAGITFIAYSMFYFVFILFERIVNDIKRAKGKKSGLYKKSKNILTWILSHMYFLIVVFFGQLIFRSGNLDVLENYLKDLFSINGNVFYNSLTLYYTEKFYLTLIIGIIFSFPVIPGIVNVCSKNKVLKNILSVAKVISYCCMAIISISYVIADTSEAFIYFQF